MDPDRLGHTPLTAPARFGAVAQDLDWRAGTRNSAEAWTSGGERLIRVVDLPQRGQRFSPLPRSTSPVSAEGRCVRYCFERKLGERRLITIAGVRATEPAGRG